MTDAEFDNDVRLTLYRFFVERGRPPVAAEIAELVDARPVDVEDALRRLHDSHVLVLAPGTPYVWMANPLSALPTPYRVKSGDREFWANCIWDGLGAVAMLGGTGSVTAYCGDCGEALTLEVDNGAIQSSDFLVHYAVPARHWWDDIGFN
ncbi:MAG: alkylmercury lyase family protein [Actinobacteria bacterium]|nr:alkylmercury lyase family protein [Actinomycetota bacterium]